VVAVSTARAVRIGTVLFELPATLWALAAMCGSIFVLIGKSTPEPLASRVDVFTS
jgi:hypothetical protein